MYEIKDARDVPNRPASLRGKPAKYPFAQMAVGQVFVIPAGGSGSEVSGKSKTPRVASAASWYGKLHGVKLSCLRQEDGSIRIERTA